MALLPLDIISKAALQISRYKYSFIPNEQARGKGGKEKTLRQHEEENLKLYPKYFATPKFFTQTYFEELAYTLAYHHLSEIDFLL